MEMPTSIRLVASSKACLAGFNSLLRLLDAAEPLHKSLMPPQTLRNQRHRFKIWANNLGALQDGRASLDFRLRDSVLMQATVHKLLTQLENMIEKSTPNTQQHAPECPSALAADFAIHYRLPYRLWLKKDT
jgi:hypothetical protein